MVVKGFIKWVFVGLLSFILQRDLVRKFIKTFNVNVEIRVNKEIFLMSVWHTILYTTNNLLFCQCFYKTTKITNVQSIIFKRPINKSITIGVSGKNGIDFYTLNHFYSLTLCLYPKFFFVWVCITGHTVIDWRCFQNKIVVNFY